MSQRQVLMVFEQYQKSRTQFVQTIAELSTRAVNIETLQAAGVMQLLRPLLLDIVPTVQQTAAEESDREQDDQQHQQHDHDHEWTQTFTRLGQVNM